MRALPAAVMRAPSLFYGAALVMFVASIALSWFEQSSAQMAYADAGDPVLQSVKLRAIYTAASEAIYIAANGVIVHVLLAIWAKLPSAIDD